jgi:GxxExxY protein
MFKEVSQEEDRIGKEIVNAAFHVHKQLGPGLLEKVYEVCFCYVLTQKGFEIKEWLFSSW